MLGRMEWCSGAHNIFLELMPVFKGLLGVLLACGIPSMLLNEFPTCRTAGVPQRENYACVAQVS